MPQLSLVSIINLLVFGVNVAAINSHTIPGKGRGMVMQVNRQMQIGTMANLLTGGELTLYHGGANAPLVLLVYHAYLLYIYCRLLVLYAMGTPTKARPIHILTFNKRICWAILYGLT